jgi:aspartyl-tRNA(Asn)/glutamyl-tRNA(Gln) amidotransferase subunit A
MEDGMDGKTKPQSAFETRLPRARPADDDLSWAPAWRLREMITGRKISPVEVTNHFLARIERLDPELHPFRQVDAEGARAQARRAEAAVMAGDPLGALHGVPLGLKEFLPIEGMSWMDLSVRKHREAPWDALETERMRAAGAVVLGPTVAGAAAQEFGDSDRMPLNPWDTARVCGDSSSGSACATASAMTPLCIAGDGLGSTRLPAAFCGLVGLHCTRGLVPSFEWEQLVTRPITTYGPLTRDVRDAAIMLSALAGPDGREVMGLPDEPDDYLARLEDGARGMNLLWTDDFGYARQFAVAETERVIETVRAAALRLQAAGAVVEPTDAVFENPGWTAHAFLMSDPILAANVETAPEKAIKARENRGRIHAALREALSGADFILTPTTLCVAPSRQAWADPEVSPANSGLYTAMTGVANLLGWPAMSVPAGLIDGMPVGLQILGRPKSEARMLQLAQAFLTAQG